MIFKSLFLILFSINSFAFTLLDNVPGWSGSSLTVYVNNSGCPISLTSYVSSAADVWNSISTAGLEINVVESTDYNLAGLTGSSYPGIAGIVCDSSFGSTDSTVGLGSYSYSSGNSYGYVRMNASGGTGDISNFTETQIVFVTAHEMGHMLNLGHSSDPTAMMYYSFGTKNDVALALDDIRGFTYLYPKDELSGEMILGCGLVEGSSRPPWGFAYLFFLLPLLVVCFRRLYPVFK